jgi:hypothetical protein
LRDYLDRDRALYGLAALFLVPFYTFKSAELDATTVMAPFWPAALLFFLRARRGGGLADAALAGAFASVTFLGKYWAVYLLAGMAAGTVTGVGVRRFWRSPAPYVMAAAALIVVSPHLYWYATHGGGDNYAFVRYAVFNDDSFVVSLGKSAYYLAGIVAYAAGPLVLLAALRPSRAALADIVWPADSDRRQVLAVFAVPLLLPTLVNLILPHRLTPDWTAPQWGLLPLVLYAPRLLRIDTLAAAKAAVTALAVALGFLVASPVIADVMLNQRFDPNRPSSQEVVRAASGLTDKPVGLFWGSPRITAGLPFYVRDIRPLDEAPSSAAARTAIADKGLLVACLDDDAPCLAAQAVLGEAEARSVDVTSRRSLFGIEGPPMRFRVTVVPAKHDDAQ